MFNQIPEPTFNRSDVEIIEEDVVFKGFFTLKRYRFKHALFAGGKSGVVEREILERGHAAILIPYDPVRDEVVLIEQIRFAALNSSSSPWLFEMVAGMMEEGESAEEVARREALEEAGLEVKRILPALNYLASPGGMSEKLSIFVGEINSKEASGIHGLASENEDIKVHVVSREAAYQMVNEGKIDNAGSVISLLWLQLNYQQIQKDWLGS
ncbi:ADP-ribose diphosphatase [Thorsellia anophelis]|uniref:ADP-ribose pyrophosphatase n=1 Tax=Thorsellia anophelis DSM 18579 TaxID=1123402 RepID=A0A1H9Y390_9GAMM|nr:ADP-ribose diphosphatase [Thorsellia anophelis]SES63217.1 ADP-ribose pyrophosphatase [Thorsellia anophelis DSM 18579]